MSDEDTKLKYIIDIEDHFIGKLTGRDKNLLVMGHNGCSSFHKKYIVYCPKCGEDPELYGDALFSDTKSHLESGRQPCGCGSQRRTDNQFKVLILRELVGTNYTFEGFLTEGKVNTRTKIKLHCNVHNESWSDTDFNHLKTGKYGCHLCRSALKSEALQESAEDIMNVVNNQGLPPIQIISRKLVKGKVQEVYYTCSRCSNDEFVHAGVCEGIFKNAAYRLKTGVRSCRCTVSRLTKDQQEYQLKKKLSNLGAKWVGWEYDNKYLAKDSFLCVCTEGHQYKVSVDNFLRFGLRCNGCVSYGFDFNEEANLYVTKWYCDGVNYLKTGITNSDVSYRNHKQYLNNMKPYENLLSLQFKNGSDAFFTEQKVKQLVGKRCATYEELPDGWTETNFDTTENYNNILTTIGMCLTGEIV